MSFGRVCLSSFYVFFFFNFNMGWRLNTILAAFTLHHLTSTTSKQQFIMCHDIKADLLFYTTFTVLIMYSFFFSSLFFLTVEVVSWIKIALVQICSYFMTFYLFGAKSMGLFSRRLIVIYLFICFFIFIVCSIFKKC